MLFRRTPISVSETTGNTDVECVVPPVPFKNGSAVLVPKTPAMCLHSLTPVTVAVEVDEFA